MVSETSPETLWKAYRLRRNIKNRNALVEHYLPWIRRVFSRPVIKHFMTPMGEDDRTQEAYIALIEAVESYDRRKEASFATYAFAKIRFRYFDSLRDLDWVPRKVRRDNALYRKAQTHFGKTEPTSQQLCEFLHLSLPRLESLLSEERHPPGTFSFDAKAHQDGDGNFLTLLEAQHNHIPDPFADIAQEDSRQAFLKRLPTRRDRQIFSLYFFQNFTMKETAKQLGLSESRISQILSSNGQALKGRKHVEGYLTV